MFGMKPLIGRPIASFCGHWNIFSAAWLNSTMRCSSSTVMIVSMADFMTAARRPSLSRRAADSALSAAVRCSTRCSKSALRALT
jgi:hypothetical protein